jgi:hypothetical protein
MSTQNRQQMTEAAFMSLFRSYDREIQLDQALGLAGWSAVDARKAAACLMAVGYMPVPSKAQRSFTYRRPQWSVRQH